MKLSLVFLWSCLLGFGQAGSLSPVTRVAELLKNLASKIDSELDAEAKLYESYVCWAKSVVSSKTSSNEKAQSRLDSLKAYLADLDSGRIELTSERADLEKEVASLRSDVEQAAALREKEASDYKAATSEMEKAIVALKEALKVLDKATKDSKSSLVSLRAKLSASSEEAESLGFGARVQEADALERAVKVGSKWLSKGDAVFLERLLSGEVPQADWKKLNRKADFKMKYKARSVKIQGTLEKLLQSFTDAKEEADKKEGEAKETYEKLKKSKTSQLEAAQEALTKQSVEGGAAAVSKADAKAEMDSLETQVKDDKKYISETETALEAKKKEFTARKTLRTGEIAAINEAISVIHSDDARDLFKRSISLLSLQTSTVSSTAGAQASAVIEEAARKSGDGRLGALLLRFGQLSGAKFDKVISAVDKMLDILKKEEESDLAGKEDCENNRAADTKESADLSRAIDELSDDVAKLQGEIKQIDEEVAEKQSNIDDQKKEVEDAKRLRADEHSEWKQNNADDTDAIALLEKSAGVLKNFYKQNFAMVQKHGSVSLKKAPVVNAGEAPPPPPKTWDGDYGGAKKESNGIIGILELIKSDVEKDQAAAKTAEETAQKNHDKFVKESKESISNLETAINELNDSKGKKEVEIGDKKSTSGNKKGALDTVVKRMKDAAPGCDFLLVNFKVRNDNRKLEMDGLTKAKAILKEKNV